MKKPIDPSQTKLPADEEQRQNVHDEIKNWMSQKIVEIRNDRIFPINAVDHVSKI